MTLIYRYKQYADTQLHVLSDEQMDVIDFCRMLSRQRNEKHDQNPFGVIDLRHLVRLYKLWTEKLPRVKPFYAYKCNNDPAIVRTLALLGAGFDCASAAELDEVIALNLVDRARDIIFAHTLKMQSHIAHAAKVGVLRLAFDSEEELHATLQHHPHAHLLLRISVRYVNEIGGFNDKFGAEPHVEAPRLLRVARSLGLDVVGIEFHVGSFQPYALNFERAIEDARKLFDVGASLGYNFTLLDIGGGFGAIKPSDGQSDFDKLAKAIRVSLDKHFPAKSGVEIIAEPGRFFAQTTVTFAACVYALRRVDADRILSQPTGSGDEGFYYYLSDGLFHTWHTFKFGHDLPACRPLDDAEPSSDRTDIEPRIYPSRLFGPTAAVMDTIEKCIMLRRLQIGDWLIQENFGAYSSVLSSQFNGYKSAEMFHLIDESTWQLLQSKVKTASSKPV